VVREGERVGPYTLLRARGSGGMGSVWEAAGPGGRHFAIKLMHSHYKDEEELVRRFHREAEVGQLISHPNLVHVYEEGVHDGVPYLVMDLAPGKSLRRLIDKGAPFFREWEAATVGAEVADALVALHARGVLHRDLKSSNIMVDRDLHARVVDYGIAKVIGEKTVATGPGFIGGPEYAPPEVFRGDKHSEKSDVYALGIVLYEMITGRVPFRSDRYTDTLQMHAERPVPELKQAAPMVSDQFDRLVYQMLQKQPARRPTPQQVANGCRSVLRLLGREGAPAAAAASPPPPPIAQPPVPQVMHSNAPPATPPRSPLPYVLTGLGAAVAVLAITLIAALLR
jgi:serine/threonine-protein kinase